MVAMPAELKLFLYSQAALLVGALVKLIVAWLGRLTREAEEDD